MDDVKKKVWLDVFASPSTLLPMAAGLTALMASWAIGGSPAMNFAGIAGVLGGIGVFASRLILGLDKITQDAYDHVLESQKKKQAAELENLEARLVKDRDSRTQNCLRELRHLYERLQAKVADGKVTPAAFDVIQGVDKLFRTCVEQLEYTLELYETAKTMRGPAREHILQQREELVNEVCDTVIHLGHTVDQFHLVTTRKNRSELARLRRELDESLQVAKRTDERLHGELSGSPQYDPQEFE